jgi:hypothetical protein
MQAKTIETPPGCGLDIALLSRNKCIKAAFPLHSFEV